MPFEGGGQGEPEATWSAAAFFCFWRVVVSGLGAEMERVEK